MKDRISERLVCTKYVKQLIMEACLNEFLEHHPEFRGMHLSQNFMLQKIAEFYLEH